MIGVFSVIALIAVLYFFDVTVREWMVANKARRRAKELGKPLLNIGSGTRRSCLTGPKLRGDVNCDLAAPKSVPCGPGRICHCDAQDLSQFEDKQFSVALIINTLGYVPNKKKALKEMHRVADEVIISTHLLPWPQWGPGPLFPKYTVKREKQ